MTGGNRVSKTINGVTTLYLVDDQNPTGYSQVLCEYGASEPATSQLLGYWKLNETSGTSATDSSGTPKNGMLTGGPVFQTGQINNGLKFDGVDDQVTVSDTTGQLQVGTAFTVAFWMRKDAETASSTRLVGKGTDTAQNFAVWEDAATHKLRFKFNSTASGELNLSGNKVLVVGVGSSGASRWYHVVCTYDGTTARIYLNGDQDVTQTYSGTPVSSAEALTMGRGPSGGVLNGMLDEVRVYNRTLSAGEVRQLSGMANVTYLYGNDLIRMRVENTSTTSYYGYDGQGSARQLFNSSQAETDRYDYDAYGMLLATTGATPNSYRYTGEQWDPDLGMYYLRARYYRPNDGRFWTMDGYEGRQGDPLSLHKYLYCSGSPTSLVDPSGLEGTYVGTLATSTLITMLASQYAHAASKAIYAAQSLGDGSWDLSGLAFGAEIFGLGLEYGNMVASAPGIARAIVGAGSGIINFLRNLPENSAPIRGYISGGFSVLRSKLASTVPGIQAEVRAARAFRNSGINVHFREATSAPTSDLLVGGKKGTGMGGIKWEVYSPDTTDINSIAREIGKK
jgi:RHS repeat-associated protein